MHHDVVLQDDSLLLLLKKSADCAAHPLAGSYSYLLGFFWPVWIWAIGGHIQALRLRRPDGVDHLVGGVRPVQQEVTAVQTQKSPETQPADASGAQAPQPVRWRQTL